MSQEQDGPGGLAPTTAPVETSELQLTLFDCSPTSSDVTLSGEAAKCRALAPTAARHSDRVLLAQRLMLQLLLDRPDGGTITIDDVRLALGDQPDRRPKWLGAVPSGLSKAGLIARAGYVPSACPCAHAHPVSAWHLVDREAAVAWLAESC